jgi:hypothetical protein
VSERLKEEPAESQAQGVKEENDEAVGGIDLAMQPSDINIRKEDEGQLAGKGMGSIPGMPAIDLNNFQGFNFKIGKLVPLTSLESFLK